MVFPGRQKKKRIRFFPGAVLPQIYVSFFIISVKPLLTHIVFTLDFSG